MTALKTPQVATQGGGYSSSRSSYDDGEIDAVGWVVSIIFFAIIACSACWRCYRYYNHDDDDQAGTGQVIVQPGITFTTAQSHPSASRQGDSYGGNPSNYQRPPKSPNITRYPPNNGYPQPPSPHTGYPSNTGNPPSPQPGYPSNTGYTPSPQPGYPSNTGYPPSPHTGYPSNTGYPPFNQYPAMQSPAASTTATENPGVGFQNPPPHSSEQPPGHVVSSYIDQPPGYVDLYPSSARQSDGMISSPFPTGATSTSPNPFHTDRS